MSTTTSSDTENESKPRSIRVQPWSEFPKQSYEIHKDQFCHETPLVVNFKTKGTRSALIIKQSLTKKAKEWNVEDDIKLWFQLRNNHSLYTRVKSTNYIKVHYDHGLYQWRDQQWNLYSSFWTDKSLSKSSVRLGFESIHPRCWSDNRLRINSGTETHNIHFYNRTLAFWHQSKFGLLAVFDLTNRVLQKNNLLLGHIFKDKHEVFLRLQNNGFRLVNPRIDDLKTFWDTLTLNYVGRLDPTVKVGIQGELYLRDNSIRKVQGVVQKILPQQAIVLKAKLNNHHDVAFLVKRAMWGYENLLIFSAGFGVKNALSQKRSQHWGVQLDFNI